MSVLSNLDDHLRDILTPRGQLAMGPILAAADPYSAWITARTAIDVYERTRGLQQRDLVAVCKAAARDEPEPSPETLTFEVALDCVCAQFVPA